MGGKNSIKYSTKLCLRQLSNKRHIEDIHFIDLSFCYISVGNGKYRFVDCRFSSD